MYPKDIKYYYRLYYATKNLTWFYSLRKFRKVRRFRIFNYLKFSNALTLKKTISKYLNYDFYYQRILMHKHIYRKINFFLYYKQKQIKKFLKIRKAYKYTHPRFFKKKFVWMFDRVRMLYEKPMFNMYKHHLLRIFKEARQTHWNATDKKTLNKRTYCNFLPKFIKNQTFLVKTALMLILQQIKLTYSWKQSLYLIDFFFYNFNFSKIVLTKGLILQFPKNDLVVTYKKLNKFKFFKRMWEQRRRQYLFVQSKKNLWMKRKKKFYKKIEFNFNQFSFLQGYYHYDIYTNSLCFVKNIKWHIFLFHLKHFSFVLKLTKWRFKA